MSPASRRLLLGGLVCSVLALAGVAHAGAPAGLTATDGWLRTLPDLPAAGYLTLRNAGSGTITLTRATSPACGSLSLHRTTRMQVMSHRSGLAPGAMGGMPGMSGMQAVASIDIPAGGVVRFAPGGIHLMCEQPDAGMAPGATVPVALHFADGSSLEANLEVRGPRGR